MLGDQIAIDSPSSLHVSSSAYYPFVKVIFIAGEEEGRFLGQKSVLALSKSKLYQDRKEVLFFFSSPEIRLVGLHAVLSRVGPVYIDTASILIQLKNSELFGFCFLALTCVWKKTSNMPWRTALKLYWVSFQGCWILYGLSWITFAKHKWNLLFSFSSLGAIYLEGGLKPATELFTKLTFDDEVCYSHPDVLRLISCQWLIPIECFHVTSCRPCWCPLTKEWRPCCYPKLILREFNSILMQRYSFVLLENHAHWSREWKHSIGYSVAAIFPVLLWLHDILSKVFPLGPFCLKSDWPVALSRVYVSSYLSAGSFLE